MSNGVEVFFPLAGPTPGMPRVRCLPNDTPQPHDPVAQVVSGGGSAKEVIDIIAAARTRRPEILGCRIKIRFISDGQRFEGASYQLALALADRMLLEGVVTGSRRVFATGIIKPDGDGDVLAIDSFPEKVRMVAGHVDKGDVFAFPFDNYRSIDAETVAGLGDLRRRGILVCPIRHIDELGFLWRSNVKRMEVPMSPATTADVVMRLASAVTTGHSLRLSMMYAIMIGMVIVGGWISLAFALS